jgi:uncharacterized protein YcaQ
MLAKTQSKVDQFSKKLELRRLLKSRSVAKTAGRKAELDQEIGEARNFLEANKGALPLAKKLSKRDYDSGNN